MRRRRGTPRECKGEGFTVLPLVFDPVPLRPTARQHVPTACSRRGPLISAGKDSGFRDAFRRTPHARADLQRAAGRHRDRRGAGAGACAAHAGADRRPGSAISPDLRLYPGALRLRPGRDRRLPGGFGADLWTFFTYAFLHADLLHLGLNLAWLLPFATALARRFGAWRYILFMLVTSAAGAFAHLVSHWGALEPMIGASAAISGAMAAAMRFVFAQGGPLASFRGAGRAHSSAAGGVASRHASQSALPLVPRGLARAQCLVRFRNCVLRRPRRARRSRGRRMSAAFSPACSCSTRSIRRSRRRNSIPKRAADLPVVRAAMQRILLHDSSGTRPAGQALESLAFSAADRRRWRLAGEGRRARPKRISSRFGAARHIREATMTTVSAILAGKGREIVSIEFARREMGGAFTWEEVAKYRDRWKKPLIVKGILHPRRREGDIARRRWAHRLKPRRPADRGAAGCG